MVGGAFLYPNLPFSMMIESKSDFHRSHLRSLLVGRSVKLKFLDSSLPKVCMYVILFGMTFLIAMQHVQKNAI